MALLEYVHWWEHKQTLIQHSKIILGISLLLFKLALNSFGLLNNNNNNNYSFWSASLRLGALTILSKNNEKKIDDYLQDFYTVDQNYNTITMMKEKKRMWLLLIEKISF